MREHAEGRVDFKEIALPHEAPKDDSADFARPGEGWCCDLHVNWVGRNRKKFVDCGNGVSHQVDSLAQAIQW
jgi:hypothetical protein